MKRTFWMTLCLFVLTLTVYWPVQHYGFIDDDDADYVFNNPHLQAGFSAVGFKYALTTFDVGNWNPLLWVSFFADRWMFSQHPGAMHAENVLLHLITGLLLWRLLTNLTGQIDCSFVVSTLFLIHPMHVESVAWISERKDVLSTPLLIGAMLAYVQYCRQTGQLCRLFYYISTIVLFCLSLLVKSMGITLPALLLLLDFWPLRRWPAKTWYWLVVEKVPLFAVSLAMVTLTAYSQKLAGATASLQELGVLARVNNAIVCYVIYLAKLVVPIKLAVFYQHPGSRPVAQVVVAGGLLTVATFFFYRVRRTSAYLLMGWLWFLGTLLPVIGLVQVGGQAMADRYSYFPSIGLLIGGVWGTSAVLKDVAARGVLAITVVGLFCIQSYRQVSYWCDTRTLFTHAANVTADNPVAHNGLALLALNQHDLKTAVSEFNLALRYGDNARAYNGLGNCWLETDRDRAIRCYRMAIALDPHPVSFHVNLASALRMNGQLDEAHLEAETAMRIGPQSDIVAKELAAIDTAKKSRATKESQK